MDITNRAAEVGASATNFFPYHEPTTTVLLILLAFIFLLPTSDVVAQAALKAGLLGPILVGLIFGTPLAGWLSDATQETITSLGYVGLLLLVFEGGLFTALGLAKANIPISLVIAATGILIPIGLSFLLLTVAFGYGPLQSFSAGAALSSTSLGTTFSILSACGLAETRVGTVLVTAAMVDDVVALILLRVITGLGESRGSTESANIGAIVGRTLGTSLALLVISYLSGRFIVIPLVAGRFGHWLKTKPWETNVKLVLMAMVAFAYIAASAYAGTSVLLGAFVAGLVCASIDEAAEEAPSPTSEKPIFFKTLYHTYVVPLQAYLLAPLFFASIGFSIPIKSMFNGKIVWRGIVYTLFMTVGKVVCGAWILILGLAGRGKEGERAGDDAKGKGGDAVELRPIETKDKPGQMAVNTPITPAATPDATPSPPASPTVRAGDLPNTTVVPPEPPTVTPAPKISFLVPTLLLGSAMVARGEIGLLISQVAFTASTGIADESEQLLPESLFLIVTWAIVLCTIIGPVSVSLTAKYGKGKMPISWS